jgi:aspartate racemase
MYKMTIPFHNRFVLEKKKGMVITMNRPLLGVIGGMGIQATARFYELLHKKQSIESEQELFDVLVYSVPTTPDRTAYITGQSPISPLDSLLHAARILENSNVSLLALLCITAHYFYNDLVKNVNVPLLSIPEQTAQSVALRGIRSVGILATDGTLECGVLHSPLEKAGINIVVPSKASQSALMTIIYSIKRGAILQAETLDTIADELRRNGAETIVLGCTELCIGKIENPGYINTLDVLAEAALRELCKTQ